MSRVRLLIFALLLTGIAVHADPVVQVPTTTPVQINLSPLDQPTQPETGAGIPTATRTPTPEGIALLEAKDFANVRAEPSTDSAQLGTIRSGTTYNVIGRYISWIQFQFPDSPTGKGWVFGDLVDLSGNVDNIPDIDPYAQSQVDSAAQGATSTQSILTQTPGGVLTATILARIFATPGADSPTDSGTHEPLPTFTYPPGMIAQAPTPGAPLSTDAITGAPTPVTTNGDDLPPLVPILLLGGVGLLGLLISALRRG